MSGNLKTFRVALIVLFMCIMGSASAQTVKGTGVSWALLQRKQ